MGFKGVLCDSANNCSHNVSKTKLTRKQSAKWSKFITTEVAVEIEVVVCDSAAFIWAVSPAQHSSTQIMKAGSSTLKFYPRPTPPLPFCASSPTLKFHPRPSRAVVVRLPPQQQPRKPSPRAPQRPSNGRRGRRRRRYRSGKEAPEGGGGRWRRVGQRSNRTF